MPLDHGPQPVGYAEPADKASTEARPRRWTLKRLLSAATALVLLVAAALYGYYYWTTGRFLVSTDDAYVQAHSVLISPRVPGYISEVPVDDNQPVRAGQVLARIDPRDYQTALDQARADVAAAQASIDTLNQQIAQQRLAVAQARQVADSDQAALVYAQQQFQRYTDLAKSTYGTVQMAQQSQADIREKRAALQGDTKGIGVAKRQVSVFEAQLAQAKATLAEQQAIEQQAELNLSYTMIRAPVDGTVGVRTLRVGEYVAGRHAADGGRTVAGRLHHCQLQGDAADRCAPRPAGHDRRRHFSRDPRARPRR